MEGKDGQVGEIVVNDKGNGFIVDLGELVADTANPNAGKKITVTYAVNTHRLLVRGHRVPMKAAKAVQKAEKKVTGITNPTLPMLALCVVIGIVIAVILVAGINSVQNKKRRRK